MKLPALLSLLLAACAAPASYAVQDGASLEQVFDRVHRSVVTLRTVSSGVSFEVPGEVTTEEGVGSGTLVSETQVLTAAHVVQTADEVQVEFVDGTVVAGRVVSSDPLSDLALVELAREHPDAIQPVGLGDSDAVRVGSQVFVVGAPLGITHTLTMGVLSARRLSPSLLGDAAQVEVFQTDASINPGNSGGPMFDMQGRLIGVVSFIVTESGGSQGLGFAVTAKTVRQRLLERMPLWSGMDFIPLAGPSAYVFNLPEGKAGMLIQRVAKGSPAERLGIRAGQVPAIIAGQPLFLGGDIVLAVMGEELEGLSVSEELRQRIRGMRSDEVLRLTVLRGGQRVELGKPIGELR